MPRRMTITSLSHLEMRAMTDPRYLALATVAASNLGHPCGTLAAAMRWLNLIARDTDEQLVLAEIADCLDVVT